MHTSEVGTILRFVYDIADQVWNRYSASIDNTNHQGEISG